jgi:hypothetical protein
MVKITKEIYEQIKIDLPKIEESFSTRNGSGQLWRRLKSKYSTSWNNCTYQTIW